MPHWSACKSASTASRVSRGGAFGPAAAQSFPGCTSLLTRGREAMEDTAPANLGGVPQPPMPDVPAEESLHPPVGAGPAAPPVPRRPACPPLAPPQPLVLPPPPVPLTLALLL